MKGISFFKSKPKTKTSTPADLVRQIHNLLNHVSSNSIATTFKTQEKMMDSIGFLLEDVKKILYGDSETQPVTATCAQLTEEFLRENTLSLLIHCLPKLTKEICYNASLILASLLRQKVRYKFMGCDYLEKNLNLIDVLFGGYETNGTEVTPLHYASMLKDCILHQVPARHVLESEIMMKKFFDYVRDPRYEVAAEATETFKLLLTRHKSIVAEFLSKNYDWFFTEYNSKLLQSTNYLTRRQAVKLLGDMLTIPANSDVMLKYVNSCENLMIVMILLNDSSKTIQVDAFRVFKLFAANQTKNPKIVGLLVANRKKLLSMLWTEWKIGNNVDKQFEAEKALVVKDILALEVKVKA